MVFMSTNVFHYLHEVVAIGIFVGFHALHVCKYDSYFLGIVFAQEKERMLVTHTRLKGKSNMRLCGKELFLLSPSSLVSYNATCPSWAYVENAK